MVHSGKGIFKILFQEEDSPSILSEVESDHELRQMIEDSRAEYTAGDKTTTEQFLKAYHQTFCKMKWSGDMAEAGKNKLLAFRSDHFTPEEAYNYIVRNFRQKNCC